MRFLYASIQVLNSLNSTSWVSRYEINVSSMDASSKLLVRIFLKRASNLLLAWTLAKVTPTTLLGMHIQVSSIATLKDPNSIFETTIRYLGGLLSAYELSDGKYPELLVKAQQVADKMIPAWQGVSELKIAFSLVLIH